MGTMMAEVRNEVVLVSGLAAFSLYIFTSDRALLAISDICERLLLLQGIARCLGSLENILLAMIHSKYNDDICY